VFNTEALASGEPFQIRLASRLPGNTSQFLLFRCRLTPQSLSTVLSKAVANSAGVWTEAKCLSGETLIREPLKVLYVLDPMRRSPCCSSVVSPSTTMAPSGPSCTEARSVRNTLMTVRKAYMDLPTFTLSSNTKRASAPCCAGCHQSSRRPPASRRRGGTAQPCRPGMFANVICKQDARPPPLRAGNVFKLTHRLEENLSLTEPDSGAHWG